MERLGGGRPPIGAGEVASPTFSGRIISFVPAFGPTSLVSSLIVHHVVLVLLVVAVNRANLDLHWSLWHRRRRLLVYLTS